jgi:hypothetical protein
MECGAFVSKSQIERLIAVMLNVFGDESSDETKERVFAVAGVIGSEDLWKPLEDKWIIRCDGIPFHAKDCDSDHGDFKIFSHRENKDRYRDLAILLAESGLGGFGFALDLSAQKEVFPNFLPALPYYKCFIEVIQKMKNCADYNKETVRFTFDMRPESEYNTGVLYAMAKRSKEWNPFIDSEIGFACSKDHPRIQVADLFARETMKALDNYIGPVKRPLRESWKCLHDTERFHMDVFGKEWFVGLKAHLPELEKQLGMSMSDYGRWLVKTRRFVDNVSNRFAYMKYIIERDGE